MVKILFQIFVLSAYEHTCKHHVPYDNVASVHITHVVPECSKGFVDFVLREAFPDCKIH